MGRTIRTFNMAADEESSRWKNYRRALLDRTQQAAFDRLWIAVRPYMAAGQNAGRLNPFESVLISMLLAHELELERLRDQIETLRAHVVAATGVDPDAADQPTAIQGDLLATLPEPTVDSDNYHASATPLHIRPPNGEKPADGIRPEGLPLDRPV